jgi:divalent metal cation (Fe/Co/Zn/Cd) transporter
MSQRRRLISEAIRWCGLSVAWALIAGTSALLAGFVSNAIALVGFGADSITDGVASAVLVWQFARERAGTNGDGKNIERRSAQAVGSILLLIGMYVTVEAVFGLVSHSHPDSSAVGVVLTAISLVLLPFLARNKLRLAGVLGSAALRGDGVLSFAGALLAAATLLSLVFDAALGWWWSDAVVALLIGAFLLREGSRTLLAAVRSPAC